ncbi:MAG TPA: FMN-binding protein [bacterium]|nr:FMN-binding protein [bacterium]
MRKLLSISALVLALLGFQSEAWNQTTVFLTPADAIKLIFKDSQEVIKEDHPIGSEQRRQAQAALGYDLPKSQYTFYIGRTGGQIDGYAIIDEQVGKVQPITFISRINPDGTVAAVEIMVYRESHGGDVASKRFLKQFRDKSLNSELRLHGDIVNISGATLSSHALVVGVKRALALWQIYYGKS